MHCTKEVPLSNHMPCGTILHLMTRSGATTGPQPYISPSKCIVFCNQGPVTRIGAPLAQRMVEEAAAPRTRVSPGPAQLLLSSLSAC